MESFNDIIGDITIYFALFYPLIYLRSYKVNGRAYKLFTGYLILVGIIQLASRMATTVFDLESNLFLSHYYFIIQFILLSFFFAELFRSRIIYWILAVVGIFLAYQYITTPDLYFKYNSTGMLVTHVFLVAYSLVYMYRSLSGKKEFMIVNMGLFVYLLSSSLIFASGNLLFDLEIPKSLTLLLFDINTYLYLAFQILIFVEWWKNYSIPKAR